MNAINFIKQHGIEKARKVVEGAPDLAATVKPSLDFKHFMYGICENAAGAYILLSDLKRLVDSLDLIKFYNGIEKANFLLEMSNRPSLRPPHPSEVKLKQAIADYESIYGGEHV